jgi:hypothetical protein
VKADVLERILDMVLAIGIVAEPKFLESDGHFDCIFQTAEALNAIIWTGSGVIDANGQMILDGQGKSEVHRRPPKSRKRRG